MINNPFKIFFSGIAGSGISAIAVFMADKGYNVMGSDRAFDLDPGHFLKKTFQSRGINIVPQDGSGIDDSINLAIFSTAVEADQPELKRANAIKIPLKTRPEYLSEITSSFKTIAVSGTSGKSTTSGLLAFLMSRLGLNPNFIGGGRVKQFKTGTAPGNSLSGSSDYLVIEACESDGTIVNYKPEHTIILNLSLDHHSVEKTAGMFKALMQNTKGKSIINNDDENLRNIGAKDAVTFSISSPSQYRAEEIEYGPFSTDFSLNGIKFRLSQPGEHNLYNAVSSIALLSEIGISLDDIAPALPEFQGIDRRFDIHLNEKGKLVIDDYAHNPHKISSLMKTIERLRDSVCYIFQPHGFAPTRMLKNEYIKVFSENLRDSDHLIILPIYYAGGTASKDISSNDLVYGIKANGKSVEVVKKRNDIFRKLSEFSTFIIFGARDESLSVFAEELAQTLFKQSINSSASR